MKRTNLHPIITIHNFNFLWLSNKNIMQIKIKQQHNKEFEKTEKFKPVWVVVLQFSEAEKWGCQTMEVALRRGGCVWVLWRKLELRKKKGSGSPRVEGERKARVIAPTMEVAVRSGVRLCKGFVRILTFEVSRTKRWP